MNQADLHADQAIRKGRSATLTEYHKTLLRPSVSKGKTEIRGIVRELIEEMTMPIRFMSLPGPRWDMENDILRRHPDATFVAFERDLRLMHAGLVNVPRVQSPRDHRRSINGTGAHWDRIDTLDTQFFETNRAHWINADFTHWTSFPLKKNKRKLFWRQNCVWLDFTSCLYSKMIQSLMDLPDRMPRDLAEIPVAVTIQGAREDSDASPLIRACGGRVECLQFLLDRKEGYRLAKLGDHRYRSSSGVPMVSFIGKWIKQPDHP